MNCPRCVTGLVRNQYEGLPVFHCQDCSGYLVATRRVDDINRRQVISQEDLKQEALLAGRQETDQSLRCPRCKRAMKRESWNRKAAFQIDKCGECELVWFDAGELALSQLEHEAKPRAQEAVRLQDRHREMTPEELTEFEQDLANLPEGDATLASAFGEGLMECLGNLARALRRY